MAGNKGNSDLQNKTLEELREMAKQQIPDVPQSEMNKEQLIQALEGRQGGSHRQPGGR